MLTKTSVSALRLLLLIGSRDQSEPVSLKSAATQLGESPTYLAKVARQLVRAGILRAQRGVAGGVTLNRLPTAVTLLATVEACQGTILGDFCSDEANLRMTCAFHQASAELHAAIVHVLSKWTLNDLLRQPAPACAIKHGAGCWIQINAQKPKRRQR